jgi:heptose I phosphotransferase
MIWLRPDFKELFPADEAFDRILNLEGEVFRELAGRRTLRFTAGGNSYFAKLHFGVGWKEIFKNLLRLRLPVLGAGQEWRAIRRFEQLGVDTMTLVAYGQRGWNPARQESFVVTEDLRQTISLEDLCRDWPMSPPPPAFKRALIARVAEIARTLHHNGVNHRDFYICHFLLDRTNADKVIGGGEPRLHVIDLHRVQIRRHTPRRWVIKDLAALFFSSIDIGLTSRDFYRFLRSYRKDSLRRILSREATFWQRVLRRAVKLYRREFKRDPQLPKFFLRDE